MRLPTVGDIVVDKTEDMTTSYFVSKVHPAGPTRRAQLTVINVGTNQAKRVFEDDVLLASDYTASRAPLTVPCPACAGARHQPCAVRTGMDRWEPVTWFHDARVEAATRRKT